MTPTVDVSTLPPVTLTSLTLGELDYFEKRSGISLSSFGEPGTPMAGPLKVLVGLALYRTGAYPTPEAAQAAAEDVRRGKPEAGPPGRPGRPGRGRRDTALAGPRPPDHRGGRRHHQPPHQASQSTEPTTLKEGVVAGHVVKVSVVAETKKFSRAFRGLAHETGLTSLVQTARTAAATLAKVGGAATLALGGLAAKGVSAAADLEQSVGAVQDVFKEGADQVLSWSAGAAKAVGLTKNEYNELATLIGAQLKNAGVSMSELGGKTNDLITLGADLSAMFGGTTAEAVAALSSALKGERDPIERYGVSLKQAAIDAKAAELGFQKVGGSFDQEAQAAATLALIMEQTSDAHGKFGREGDTLAHQVAMHIAAMSPVYVTRDEIPADVVENERRIAEATAREEGKPEGAIPRIIEGRLGGFYKDVVLLDQLAVWEDKKTVGDVLKAAGAQVKRFARLAVGA